MYQFLLNINSPLLDYLHPDTLAKLYYYNNNKLYLNNLLSIHLSGDYIINNIIFNIIKNNKIYIKYFNNIIKLRINNLKRKLIIFYIKINNIYKFYYKNILNNFIEYYDHRGLDIDYFKRCRLIINGLIDINIDNSIKISYFDNITNLMQII